MQSAFARKIRMCSSVIYYSFVYHEYSNIRFDGVMTQIMNKEAKYFEECCISAQGLQQMLERPRDPTYPDKHVLWTDDYRVELPIKLTKSGIGSTTPFTLIDAFHSAMQRFPQRPALSQKINGKWLTFNYKQYYDECMAFAKALIAMDLPQHTTINIIGFNFKEWFFTFLGSAFAKCIPVGIYATNSPSSCEYVAEHSECKVIVAENREHAKKYLNLLRQGKVVKIVVYNDEDYFEAEFPDKIVTYKKFVQEGQRVENKYVEKRMARVRAGNCLTLVYTSGTTGMPKGVMLSHDNYTWLNGTVETHIQKDPNEEIIMVSYLPLSHVAGQYSDIVSPIMRIGHVYIAQPTALQGTLIDTIREVRPTAFMSVPRVWEKIYDKMMEMAKSNGAIKTAIAKWAKALGPQGTMAEVQNKETSLKFKLAKALIFDKIKAALGFDRCKYFFFGAAPLDPTIRRYFLSLNFFLINSYGMSESSGPQNFTHPTSLDISSLDNFREVGISLKGTELKIMQEANPSDDTGELCYRGRHIFMGYFKNPEQTSKALDKDGFLHSGDNGRISKEGVLFITGRSKELIVTAGGENIPPILIENVIKAQMPFIANVMLVGDMRRFLSCLVTLKQEPPASGTLSSQVRDYLSLKGVEVKTVKEAIASPKVRNIIKEGIDRANEKAISKAQAVQEFIILAEDFSVENQMLTPTLKLKRKEVLKKYSQEIQKMYANPKL